MSVMMVLREILVRVFRGGAWLCVLGGEGAAGGRPTLQEHFDGTDQEQ